MVPRKDPEPYDSPAARELFDELCADLSFGEEERRLLVDIRPIVSSRFGEVVSDFYEIIRRNAKMRAVFDDDAQIERQKAHLERWLQDIFAANYDDDYLERNARVGLVHVRIGLDPRYMTSMMSVLRASLVRILSDSTPTWDTERRRVSRRAIESILDIELAMMQHAFKVAHLKQMRAQERLATLGQFAASIGHELRNPLAVVDSSAHIVLRQEGLSPRVEKHARRIKEQAELCARIVSGVLDIARDMPLNRTRVSLSRLVQTELEDVRIVLELEEAYASADPALLAIVLSNLVDNARKSGAQTIRVATRTEGDQAVLCVTDDGPGVPANVRNRVFEPLVSGREGGVGLGLALCRRIVQEHGGEIEVADVEGGGTVFTMRIAAVENPE